MSDTTKFEYSTIWCKYKFSEEELRKIAETLAMKTQELAEIEEEKKAVASAFKERGDRVSAEQRSAARKYKDGYEMRNIECEVRRDYDAGIIRYIRTDTGEIAQETQMSMAERQLTLEQAINDATEDQGDAETDDAIDVEYKEIPPGLAKYLDDKPKRGRRKKQDAPAYEQAATDDAA